MSRQVAHASRVMHMHKFAHNDWKWRNILVSGDEAAPQITLIDCPAGMFWCWRFFEYRRIKDLACLDKIGRRALSRHQGLRFVRYYLCLGSGQVFSTAQRQQLNKIEHFSDGRD